jgi:hypothetical protein
MVTGVLRDTDDLLQENTMTVQTVNPTIAKAINIYEEMALSTGY